MAKVSVILHDIRSSENVGSIFRSADASGVSKIYLTGYTPAPEDRFGRKNSKLAKTALGAEESIDWKHFEDIGECVISLKKEGAGIVGVELAQDAIDYRKYSPPLDNVAFVFGNEVTGLSQDILNKMDAVIEIPMQGEKESLNVSVAAGIILFQYLKA